MVTQPEACTTSRRRPRRPPPPPTTIEETTTTTTVPESTTTTTIEGDLAVTAITPVCVHDAPYVAITFGDQPEFNGRPATITFIDLNGTVVAAHTATYAANATVTFVYPGASVDAAGNPTDWPGWVFDGDEWVPDPTDDFLRDGLTVRVDVNPTATGQVSYPPATTSCADPTEGGSTTTTPGTLPTTGGSATGGIAWAGGLALLLGVGAMALARRRAA